MAITNPATNITLLKSPLQEDGSNPITFTNTTAQFNYFNNLPKRVLDDTECTYQRKDSIIRFNGNVDELYGFTYVMYKNSAFSDKWFYAFITDLEYINDHTTFIHIKTDVFETWQFDIVYRQCFIEREHVNDDTPGSHTIPENLELGEYQIVDLRNSPLYESAGPSSDFKVVFAVTKVPTPTTPPAAGLAFNGESQTLGGAFTSLHFFAVDNFGAARNVITVYNETSDFTSEAIQNVYLVPANCVNFINNPSILSSSTVGGGVAIYPLHDSVTAGPFQLQQPAVLAGGYRPVNNKLYAYPFSYFYVSNKAGEDVVYRWEDFPIETLNGYSARTMTYKKAIVPSASLSAKLYFTKYKNYSEGDSYGTRMYNYGINFAKLPICAWTTDYYTNWLTQNGVNNALNVTGAVAGAVGGVASGVATGNPLLAAGATFTGVIGVSNAIAEQHRAATTPPQAHGDIGAGDVMYGFTRNSISFYEMSIRPEMAAIIDKFFSAYGYKVNLIKTPNISGRRNWNYVKTLGCNFTGQIPQNDLSEIRSLFDNGITLWHNPNTYLDYTANNGII